MTRSNKHNNGRILAAISLAIAPAPQRFSGIRAATNSQAASQTLWVAGL